MATDGHGSDPSAHAAHAALAPSPWVQRWSHLVPPAAGVLDVACGSGRHVRWFATLGCRVTGVDRDADAIAALRADARLAAASAELVVADIESAAWPFAGRRFDAVVVVHYLHRPLLPTLVDAVADGGVLIYETFAVGQQAFGRPSNPAFLLQPGELLRATQPLRVIAYEDGLASAPDRCVQRVVAARETPSRTRWPLDGPG